MFIDDDAERHAVQAGDDAAVELRRARVERDGVAAARIADRLSAVSEQLFQHSPLVVLRAADDEVVGSIAPVLLQPGDVRFEAAGGDDDGLRCDFARCTIAGRHRREKFTVTDLQFGDLGFVGDLHAGPRGGVVVRVHHRLATAQHEEITLGQVQRAAQGLLPTDAVGRHPIAQFFGVLNRQAGETLVRLASGDLPEVLPELLLRVCAGDIIGRSPVHVTNVTGVAAVTAAKILGRAFQHRTRAPPRRAVMAAHSPALPPPTTSTSKGCVSTVHPHLNPLPSETVSQCHPEAVAEGSRICKDLQSLDSSPAAQNDIRVIFVLRHSLSTERKFLSNRNG